MNELSALWEAAPWLVAGGALVIINIVLLIMKLTKKTDFSRCRRDTDRTRYLYRCHSNAGCAAGTAVLAVRLQCCYQMPHLAG